MTIYILFLFVTVAIIYIGEVTRTKGFEKLTVKRKISSKRVTVGEEFKITTIVENNKWLPISFLVIREYIPKNIIYLSGSFIDNSINMIYISNYSIGGHERVKRISAARAAKRGVYQLDNVDVTIGDMFGFSYDENRFEDFKEIIVYPEVTSMGRYKFTSNGIQGDNIVKRWIYEEPLYIKGVREYGPESRMKDIHWKASAKMGKFMVKEYEHTSDMQFTVMLNVQLGKHYWQRIDSSVVEEEIKLSVAIISDILKEKIPAGICTNAMLVGGKYFSDEVKPSQQSLNKVLELCARIGYDVRTKFSDYLLKKAREFSKNNTYIIITPYLDKESINVLGKLSKAGFSIKIIDMSQDGSLSSIRNVEKVVYNGVIN